MSDRAAPYPADTKSKGWRFELDLEQIDQSDTWALTPADLRPWLLMLWASAWRQTPCGSLPDDDALIAVRIGMKQSLFTKNRPTLLRGWWKADDGRLYHDTVAKRVVEMLAARDKEKARKAEYRKRKEAEEAETAKALAGLSHGTDSGHPRDSLATDDTRTSTSTGTSTGLLTTSVPYGTDASASDGESPPPGLDAKDAIFQVAVPWLVERGVPDKSARSLMGGAMKQLGDGGAWNLAQRMMEERPLEPAGWLAGAINKSIGKGKGANRHGNFDKQDYRAGVSEDGSF